MKAKTMKKWSSLSMAVMLSMALMTACGSADSESTSSSQTTVNGFVTEISGNEITMTVMQNDKGGMGQGQGKDDSQGGDNSNKGDKPQGTPPADAGQNGKMNGPASGGAVGERPASGGAINDSNAETKTITVSDDTKVTVQNGDTSSEGSINDISLNSMITVTMDGDTVSEISIRNFSNQSNN